MDKTIISDKPLYLSIGDYLIKVVHDSIHQEAYYLPKNAEPFLDKNDNYLRNLDINYTIQLGDYLVEPNQVEHSFIESNQLNDSFIGPKAVLVANFDDGPFSYRIYLVNSNIYLWIRYNKLKEVQYAYRISKDWSTWRLIADNSASLGKDSFAELVYIFAYSIINKGGILFHGVVMEWQERGYLFCAHSGVGKTTHTRMWRDSENAHILNGDRALCSKEKNGWYAYGAPWSGSSGEYRNSKAPLTAIIILEQSGSNEVSFLDPLHGALELMQLAFAPSWEESLMNDVLDTIDDIVGNVPVLKLKCRPDLEAVSVLKSVLQEIIDVNVNTDIKSKINRETNSETSR